MKKYIILTILAIVAIFTSCEDKKTGVVEYDLKESKDITALNYIYISEDTVIGTATNVTYDDHTIFITNSSNTYVNHIDNMSYISISGFRNILLNSQMIECTTIVYSNSKFTLLNNGRKIKVLDQNNWFNIINK